MLKIPFVLHNSHFPINNFFPQGFQCSYWLWITPVNLSRVVSTKHSSPDSLPPNKRSAWCGNLGVNMNVIEARREGGYQYSTICFLTFSCDWHSLKDTRLSLHVWTRSASLSASYFKLFKVQLFSRQHLWPWTTKPVIRVIFLKLRFIHHLNK